VAASEERLVSLREMLDEEPQSEFLRYGVALQLKGLGRADPALAEFAHLVEHHAEYVPTYYHYAALLGEGGETERAIAVARMGQEQANAAGDAHAAAELGDLIDELDA
jgi:hypothetical protein